MRLDAIVGRPEDSGSDLLDRVEAMDLLTVKQGMRIEVHLDRHIRQIGTLERLYRERAGPAA